MTTRGIILSDIDGTFLDHEYRPVLSAGEFAAVVSRWRVIWATSRTADEVRWLQRLLKHRDDALVENGGACLTYSAAVARAMGRPRALEHAFLVILGDDLSRTLALVDEAFASVGRKVLTFLDLSPEELATRAGYSADEARLAQYRAASVVLVDVDSMDPATQMALGWLRRRGCDVSAGHRWITVVGGADKGRSARRWLAAVPHAMPIVAIGDGENDEPLLRAAEHRFVIRRRGSGHHAALAAIEGAHLLTSCGTSGWREMLSALDHVTP